MLIEAHDAPITTMDMRICIFSFNPNDKYDILG